MLASTEKSSSHNKIRSCLAVYRSLQDQTPAHFSNLLPSCLTYTIDSTHLVPIPPFQWTSYCLPQGLCSCCPLCRERPPPSAWMRKYSTQSQGPPFVAPPHGSVLLQCGPHSDLLTCPQNLGHQGQGMRFSSSSCSLAVLTSSVCHHTPAGGLQGTGSLPSVCRTLS